MLFSIWKDEVSLFSSNWICALTSVPDNQSQRVLAADELKMERFKQKLQTALDKLVRAERVVEGKQKQLSLESDHDKRQKLQESLDKKILATTKLRVAYENLNAEGP